MRCIPMVLMAFALQAHARMVHVGGTIAQVKEMGIRTRYLGLNVQGVGDALAVGLQVNAESGRFEGELDLPVIRSSGRAWVDIHLVAVPAYEPCFRTMTIRVPHARSIDLGAFEWKPSRYRWKSGALVIDTAVPRDTMIGEPWGNHIVISPINPAPKDSIRFTFQWGTNNPSHVAHLGGLYMKDCCTLLCDLTFAERTDTDVYGESWRHDEKLILPPPLGSGRYRLRQVPATGEHLRDVDFLLNTDLYFTVAERTEP